MEYQDKFTNFDCTGDPSNIGPRWGRWLSSFEIFADSRGLILEEGKDTHKQRRRALLLHSAGQTVQDIFLTLPNTGSVKDYEKAVTALSTYCSEPHIRYVKIIVSNHILYSRLFLGTLCIFPRGIYIMCPRRAYCTKYGCLGNIHNVPKKSLLYKIWLDTIILTYLI